MDLIIPKRKIDGSRRKTKPIRNYGIMELEAMMTFIDSH